MRTTPFLLVGVAALLGFSSFGGPMTGVAQAAAADAAINIPKDARWTIFCKAFSEPNHAGAAKAVRTYLLRATSMRDWYIVQGEGQTTLYYGFYTTVDDKADKKEAARAHADRTAIRNLVDPATGQHFFPSAIHVTLDTADPAAPPEWNLVNAPAGAVYTLQIGICKDDPDRKLLAVQAVREARAAGHEAYYYHGPTSSSVCIGAWPKEAVVVPRDRPRNPNAVRMTLPGSINVRSDLTTSDGRPVEVVQSQVEIEAPTLLAAMKAFPVTTFNGIEARIVKDSRTGQKREVRMPSRLVEIPRDATAARPPAAAGGATPDTPAVSPAGPEVGTTSAPPPPRPPVVKPKPPPGGTLKSLGD